MTCGEVHNSVNRVDSFIEEEIRESFPVGNIIQVICVPFTRIEVSVSGRNKITDTLRDDAHRSRRRPPLAILIWVG